LAPLPQNNTARVFIDYVTGTGTDSKPHTVQIRHDGSETNVAGAQLAFLNVLEALGASLFRDGWKVTGVRSQEEGSNFSFPVPIISGLAAFEGTATGDYAPADEASEVTFQGRSFTSGRRVDFSLYTAVIGPGQNFRFTVADPSLGALVQDAIDALVEAGEGGIFLCIDGTVPSWQLYMNQNNNSYWEDQIRK